MSLNNPQEQSESTLPEEATPSPESSREEASPLDAALDALNEESEPGGPGEEETPAEEGASAGEKETPADEETRQGEDNPEADDEGGEEEGGEGEGGDQADDLTPPDGLSERASERFQRLASQVKELREQVAAERSRAEQVTGMLRETGATPEELGRTLEFVRLAKRGDHESLKQAASMAREWLQQISATIGETVEIDPLTDHPELAERVKSGELNRNDAMEIVRAKTLEQQVQARMQNMSAQQQAEARYQAEVTQAIESVNALEQEWAKADPDWNEKRDLLMSKTEEIAASMPPSAWPQAVRIAYDAINTAFERSKTQQPAPAPISSSQGQPAAPTVAPKTTMEAALAALGDL